MEKIIAYSQEQEKKLQNEAICFIKQTKLILNGIIIIPKEIEVYYYREGIFSDQSVHQNELQQNNKNHFYVHRIGKTKNDRYKGGNRAGVDFVISDEKGVYYSYLIRSAVINGKTIYGPHNVLENIKKECNLEYNDIESIPVKVETFGSSNDVILSKRINLGRGFVNSKLRAVIFDNDFKSSKYKNKEILIREKIKNGNMPKEEAIDLVKKNMGYVPSSIKEL